MHMDYNIFPLIPCSDRVSNTNREDYYKRNSNIFSAGFIDALRTFQTADFLISGTSYLLPECIVSPQTKAKLFYLQGFVIIEGDARYYTQRADLESFELCYTLEGSGRLRYL